MSLVPRNSLPKILDSVHDSQKHASDRLTLAKPLPGILSHYDAKLSREISKLDEGVLLTLSKPLASARQFSMSTERT